MLLIWKVAKTLCWKIGESFIKVQSNADDYYGKIFATRKRLEWQRNLDGLLADQATANLPKYKGESNAKLWYSGKINPNWVREMMANSKPFPEKIPQAALIQSDDPADLRPMLPPAHIHARARRYAVKLFLAHYHEVAYWHEFGKRSATPYAIAILGHADYIPPPNAPWGDSHHVNQDAND